MIEVLYVCELMFVLEMDASGTCFSFRPIYQMDELDRTAVVITAGNVIVSFWQ